MSLPHEKDSAWQPGMFRGATADYWVDRLKLRGWPEDAARVIAEWLCDRKAQPPRWDDLNRTA